MAEPAAAAQERQRQLGNQLFEACERLDWQEAISLVEKGADTEERSEEGFTPLLYACANGQIELVQLLIAHGARADVNSLYYTINSYSRDVSLVNLLIEKGALERVEEGQEKTINKAVSEEEWNTAATLLELVRQDERRKEAAKARATADFKKSLEAALAKGSVEVEVLKCVTLGPTEAGKTQLKCALIGNFDRSSESTPMSTGAEAVMQRYVRGKSTWEPLTRERLCMSLHTTVKKKMFTESASPSPTKANSSTQRNEAQALRVEPKKIEPLKIGMRGGTGVHETASGALGHRADSKKGLRRQFAAIKASVQEELKEVGTVEMKGLDKVRIIHMVDSGGQPAFFDIHPVIATSRAVYLLVYNMEEGLDHKPAITYRRKAFPTKQLQNTKQSNLDMIKDSLLTLHDCKQKFTALERELHHWFGDAISESADELPVLVVGTRKRKESIAYESEKLAKECSYLPLWKKVLHSTDTGTKLFAVESMDPGCQGVQSVRQEVDQAECIFKLPLPVSWFLCQLIFLSVDENLHVLTFSNLQDLCLQEGLISNPDEFLAMVRTFHLLGIFSFPYLDQELTLRDCWRPDDKPVFTNPDVLYQQVTKILEMAYRDLAKTVMKPKARESLIALQSSGRLDSDTLGYLGIPDDLGFYSGFHAYLLERLVHWGLAAKPTTEISKGAAVNGRAAFFIPSVLPDCDEEPVTCSESPLFFTFCLSLADGSKIHYVPRGIFPHLVVLIEGQGYEIQENTNYQSCLFRDVATFGIEPSRSNKMLYAYNVMVVDKMDRVTIAIDPAQENKLSTTDCRRIVSDFKQAMESVYEGIYQVSLSVTEASECRCNKRLPSHLAMVILCEDGSYAMQCLLPGKIKRYPCPPELAVLLCDQDGAASSFSSNKLSPRFVARVAECASEHWYEFALYLGITSERLDVIRSDNRRQANTCCREALHQWLSKESGTGGQRREESIMLEAVRKACGPLAVDKLMSSHGPLLQEVPLSEGDLTQLESTPTLAALREHVVPVVAAEWRAMSDFLDVLDSKQKEVEATKRGDVSVICREVLNQWLKHVDGTGDLPRTWQPVLTVVADTVGQGHAMQVKQLVCPGEL